jgi:hypothetical protein
MTSRVTVLRLIRSLRNLHTPISQPMEIPLPPFFPSGDLHTRGVAALPIGGYSSNVTATGRDKERKKERKKKKKKKRKKRQLNTMA